MLPISLVKGDEVVEAREKCANLALLCKVFWYREFSLGDEFPISPRHFRTRRNVSDALKAWTLNESVEERPIDIQRPQNPEISDCDAPELRV